MVGDAYIGGLLNVGGYSAFGVREYVRFNYVASTLTIQAQSAGISSVVRSALGRYIVNFSPALPTSNYLVQASGYHDTVFAAGSNTNTNPFGFTTSSFNIQITDPTNNSAADPADNCCVFILF